MRPDYSVLFLTTLIGAGQGLFLALATVELYVLFGLLPPVDGHLFFSGGSLVALALLAAGLVASFFHLGRPGRAWRAAAQWRTSWLSREVIVLPALMAVVACYGAAHLAGWRPALASLPSGLVIDAAVGLALAGSLLAFALYGCTAMIYAGLPVMREWATLLTPLNYTLLGGASGFTCAAAWAAWAAPGLARFLAGWALILTLLGLAGRCAALVRNRRLRPKSTLQTALGIKHPRIAQGALAPKGGAFNANQFFHGADPARLRTLTALFLAAGFVIPALLLAGGTAATAQVWLSAAAAVQMAGLLVERWCFFAEATHPQNLYFSGRPGAPRTSPPPQAPVRAGPAFGARASGAQSPVGRTSSARTSSARTAPAGDSPSRAAGTPRQETRYGIG